MSTEKVEFGGVPKKGGSGRVPEKVEFRQVLKKCKIWASTRKVEIQASIEKVESGLVSEKGLGEYRERVESRRVQEM